MNELTNEIIKKFKEENIKKEVLINILMKDNLKLIKEKMVLEEEIRLLKN